MFLFVRYALRCVVVAVSFFFLITLFYLKGRETDTERESAYLVVHSQNSQG